MPAPVIPSSRTPGRLAGFGLLALSLIPLAAASRLSEATRPLVLCGLKALTGLPCPLCGGIRATAALARGAPLEAFLWNPAAVLLHAGFLLTGLLVASGKKPPSWLQEGGSPAFFRGALLLLLMNWIYLVAAGR